MNPTNDMQQSILKELGLESLPADKQQEVIAMVGGPVFQAVTLAIFEQLPKEQHPAFSLALESGDSVEIERIITANIPDSTTLIEGVVRDSIAEIKKLSGK